MNTGPSGRRSAALVLAVVLCAGGRVRAGGEDAVDRALAAPSPPVRASALAAIPPDTLDARLRRDPEAAARVRAAFAGAFAAGPPDPAVARGLAALDRARVRALSSGDPSPEARRALLEMMFLDGPRFVADAAFRGRVLAVLAGAWEPAASPALRARLLSDIGASGALSFDASEALQSAWGAVARRSALHRGRFPASGTAFPSDISGTIRASIYSLPSSFFRADDAGRFLSAVRKLAPDRTILAFSDLPLSEILAGASGALGVRVLETFGRGYTPWTRDTFSLLPRPGGGVLAVARPPGLLQAGRERDREMARELVKDLPDEIDRAWHGIAWAGADVPFHNGQALVAPPDVWISLHTLEPAILRALGLERVPVASFSTARGIDAYLRAARGAAARLGRFYGRTPRFVHALPESGSAAERSAAMDVIGGGAGFDLDSYLTLLPGPDGRPRALVADVSAGLALLRGGSDADRRALSAGFGIDAGPALEAYASSPRVRRFGRYLDAVAANLSAQGLAVSRLPILLVPVDVLRDRSGTEGESDFLLTWNNVVVQSDGAGTRAEGFSSLYPPGDRAAEEIFAAAGCRLAFLPPLVRSVVGNGGYRCASNHLRVAGR